MSALDSPRVADDEVDSLGLPPMPELTPEEEAALDSNPRERLYPMNKIEAPSHLASTLGAFTKLVMLQHLEGSGIADYAVEYFEQLKLARAADPRIDFERFLGAQLRMMQKKLEPHTYEFESEFAPPADLAPLLFAFSKEVIRFQPVDLFGFALEYFTEVATDKSADAFLARQAKLADEKQRLADIEKKRAAAAKAKRAAAAAAAEEDE